MQQNNDGHMKMFISVLKLMENKVIEYKQEEGSVCKTCKRGGRFCRHSYFILI